MEPDPQVSLRQSACLTLDVTRAAAPAALCSRWSRADGRSTAGGQRGGANERRKRSGGRQAGAASGAAVCVCCRGNCLLLTARRVRRDDHTLTSILLLSVLPKAGFPPKRRPVHQFQRCIVAFVSPPPSFLLPFGSDVTPTCKFPAKSLQLAGGVVLLSYCCCQALPSSPPVCHPSLHR